MVFYYFGGMAHYQKNDEDAALHEFRQGVAQVRADASPDLVSDLYAVMGDILYKKKDKQAAYAAYDSCLQWKDDNIMALNNYAYYMSEEGVDLHKAESMSYKTVKAEPNNGTYLDTCSRKSAMPMPRLISMLLSRTATLPRITVRYWNMPATSMP